MMTIQPIVEGHGEEKAVPLLLKRMLKEAKASSQIRVEQGIRRKRHEFTSAEGVRYMVGIARRQPDCSAILILFDSDGDCPQKQKA